MKKGVFCFTIIGMTALLLTMAFGEMKTYVGIGVQFWGVDSNTTEGRRLKNFGVRIMVNSILKNGPADRAGIRVGDGLASIKDGDDTFTMSSERLFRKLDAAVDRIAKGEEGTMVTVTVVRRDGYGFLREKTFEVVRERIILNEYWLRPE